MAKKILIVEDNAQDRKIIMRNLIKHGYKDLIFTPTGEEGIMMAKSEKPDLIILDINLPKMSGVEVHMILKRDPATQNIPILFNTKLLKEGNTSYDWSKTLAKSLLQEDLGKTVKMILDANESSPKTT